jgi:ABC-type sugar transport system permease subunit
MNKRAALLMLLPAGIFFLLSFLGPMVLVGRLSLYRTDYVTSAFVGFQNYLTAFQDKYFLKSFVNSFIFVGMTAPLMIFAAYKIASLLSQFPPKIQSAGRFIIYIPGLISGLIITLLWGWLLDRNGLVNSVLGTIGVPAVPWLSEAWPARMTISMMSVSSGVGGFVILFAAYMKSIPKDLHDAATVDGASDRQYRKYIVWPIMIPTVLLALLLLITGIMQMWESVYVLFGKGGPEGSAASPVYEIFLTGFKFGKQGLAAAKGIILMVVIAAILLLKQRIEKWVS